MPQAELLVEDKGRTRRELGDAIKGDKIEAQARKFSLKGVCRGSGRHQIQRYNLDTNAYCVISKPLIGLHKTVD